MRRQEPDSRDLTTPFQPHDAGVSSSAFVDSSSCSSRSACLGPWGRAKMELPLSGHPARRRATSAQRVHSPARRAAGASPRIRIMVPSFPIGAGPPRPHNYSPIFLICWTEELSSDPPRPLPRGRQTPPHDSVPVSSGAWPQVHMRHDRLHREASCPGYGVTVRFTRLLHPPARSARCDGRRRR